MQNSQIDDVIQELVTDKEFRDNFISNPRSALQAFVLTQQHLAALLAINVPVFLSLIEQLGELDGGIRISKLI